MKERKNKFLLFNYFQMAKEKLIMEENLKDLDKSLSISPDKSLNLERAKNTVNYYFTQNVVNDFSQIPEQYKIAMVQRTPKMFVKTRKVGKEEVPYVSHTYAEKALNFISDFQWGSEQIDSEFSRFKDPKRVWDSGKKCYVHAKNYQGELEYNEGWECVVTLRCWLMFKGKRIERVVTGGHRQYDNPAISKADCKKSAISKAYTTFAKTFGIGVDLDDVERASYEKIQEAYASDDVDTSDFS